MSDKDYLLEMLTTEKNISVNLVYALNEASINKITKDIYEECVNKGYYQKNNIPYKKIMDSYNQLSKEII